MATATKQISPLHKVRVDIMGESYVIKGEADPGYISDVARMVDSRMREIRASSRDLSKTRLAVLTAINLADELLRERNIRHDPSPESEELSRRTRQLITLLDEGLVGDTIY